VPPIQLGVFEDNARGSHVYEKVGFRLGPALRAEVFDGRTEVYMVAETGL
jgi:RimJ/RimL family protein N-acetyltransferase